MIRRLDTDKGYVKYHLEDYDNSIWIIDAIEANGRRNGNGSSLLKEVEEIIRNEGGRRIELYAYPQDDSITEDELCDSIISTDMKITKLNVIFQRKFDKKRPPSAAGL